MILIQRVQSSPRINPDFCWRFLLERLARNQVTEFGPTLRGLSD